MAFANLSKPKTNKIVRKRSLKEFFQNTSRKSKAIFVVALLAAIGAYFLFFASAATNNCQTENNAQICDVDQTISANDSVLSLTGEAENLGKQGWGMYIGAAFRAPTSAYNGAVPAYRVFSDAATMHDYVTVTQKSQKEAKYGALKNEGIPFYVWTQPGQPGTVPVYKISSGGKGTANAFSTDKAWIDNMLAQGANNPDGWKSDPFGYNGGLIAFYAYPPTYTVSGLVNPYDCSLQVNFYKPQCDKARENLFKKISDGAPVGSTCPQTLAIYQKAPLVSQFDAACQKQWNDFMQRCDIVENFNSDRCKGPREALAKASKEAIAARQQVAKDDAKAGAKDKAASAGKAGSTAKPAGTNPPAKPAGTKSAASTPNSAAVAEPTCDIQDAKTALDKNTSLSKDCIRYWQKKSGTKADGLWGAKTTAAVAKLVGITPPANPSGTSSASSTNDRQKVCDDRIDTANKLTDKLNKANDQYFSIESVSISYKVNNLQSVKNALKDAKKYQDSSSDKVDQMDVVLYLQMDYDNVVLSYGDCIKSDRSYVSALLDVLSYQEKLKAYDKVVNQVIASRYKR